MSDRGKYYQGAESWATDTRGEVARSKKIAWTVAGVAAAVAVFEAVALAMLTPLKTVQPVTLLVDRQTGYVQALNPLEPRRVGADAVLTQSFLAQYVNAREGFDRATVRTDYRKVALWSAGRARASYISTMAATNPASPLRRNGVGTIVTVRVKSVSRLEDGVALVRFDSQVLGRTGGVEVAQPWISVVRYRYVDAPMQLEDRLVNPLGFQVTGYRRDAEAPPPAEAQVISVASTTPPATTVVEVVQPAASAPLELRRRLPQRIQRPSGGPHIRPGLSDQSNAIQVGSRSVPINNLPLGSPLTPPAFVVVPTGDRP